MTHIVSVSWGDHLIFGEGDGRLATPEAVWRRMKHWREELGAKIVHWRVPRTQLEGRFYRAKGYPRTQEEREQVNWNYREIVPKIAHRLGMQVYLYISIFDEGWPLPPKRVRAKSYHNAMHGQHITWQSDFSRQNPEYTLVDRTGDHRQWGVMSLSYLVVRAYFRERIENLLANTRFDGLFICLRSQSRPAVFADQFGFNEPIQQAYLRRYGRDILTEDFDLQAWRDLQGEYLSQFLREIRTDLRKRGTRLAVGAARGDVLGPPLGNTTLAWREWIQEGLVDELIINQNSSKCPSMWHDLWPMHRGYGYLQNYLDGHNMPLLLEHIDETYAPVVRAPNPAGVRLYVARQWDERSEEAEAALMGHPAVSGLVFSSFRHDNPKAIERGNWTA